MLSGPLMPVGIQDFKVVRDRESRYYYVDKSRLIDDIIDRPGETSLYVRPRRFGKSLNLSMLDAYLNFRYAGNDWFDGLDISDIRRDDPLKNSFPVLHLNFQNLDVESFDDFVSSFRVLAQNLYSQFPELDHSDRLSPEERRLFRSVVSVGCDEDVLRRSTGLLCTMVRKVFGSRAVVLIDEYDTPANETHGSEDRQRITDFITDVLRDAFGDGNVQYGVAVGITQAFWEEAFGGT